MTRKIGALTIGSGRARPEPSSGMNSLSQDTIETARRSFLDNGYAIFRGVVPRQKLETLRGRVLEEFDRANENGALFAGGGLISGHLNCFPGEESRVIFDELTESGLVSAARSIFPKAVHSPNVGCNLNLPNSVAQHYHSDSAFTQDFLVMNVAAVDTDLVNGAIDVLPGTQKKFYKFWRFALERAHRRSTRLPMKQGDVLIRTSTLWHRGMPNYTATPRPMLAFTWEDGGTLKDSFRANEGRVEFRPNWYSPNLLGRLRERTFVAAPITYSAYRFARSLVGNKGFDVA